MLQTKRRDDLALEIYNSRDYQFASGVPHGRGIASEGGTSRQLHIIASALRLPENAGFSGDRSAAATPEPAESISDPKAGSSVPPPRRRSAAHGHSHRARWNGAEKNAGSDERPFPPILSAFAIMSPWRPQTYIGLGETISFRIIAELRDEVPVECWRSLQSPINTTPRTAIRLAVTQRSPVATSVASNEILLHLRGTPNLRQGKIYVVVTLDMTSRVRYNGPGPRTHAILCHGIACVYFSMMKATMGQ